ncbi:MAG: helix-turn-helix domain-containing protein [Oscillospiraceae bacterium]|nr:helix-turn-helix domain-containing protein [Oscillospiraceae bacterium]
MTALARNLKRSRENANIYQAELGNRVGVSQTQIAHYESGKKIPSVVTLERIATELEVSVDYLLGRSA